jgi:hypothetical protein
MARFDDDDGYVIEGVKYQSLYELNLIESNFVEVIVELPEVI